MLSSFYLVPGHLIPGLGYLVPGYLVPGHLVTGYLVSGYLTAEQFDVTLGHITCTLIDHNECFDQYCTIKIHFMVFLFYTFLVVIQQ